MKKMFFTFMIVLLCLFQVTLFSANHPNDFSNAISESDDSFDTDGEEAETEEIEPSEEDSSDDDDGSEEDDSE